MDLTVSISEGRVQIIDSHGDVLFSRNVDQVGLLLDRTIVSQIVSAELALRMRSIVTSGQIAGDCSLS